MPANDYYDHGSFPSPGAPGASASLRAEFELIETGFNKMPTITGNAGKFVRVNLLGTALEPVTAITGVTFDGVIGGTTPAAGTFTTLTSTGAATLNSLAVTLNATIGGTLSATGTATFAGNAAVGGNLAVTGTITSPTITAKANKAGETYTGTHDFSGATSVIVPTATSGGQAINLTQLTATAFSAALPSQTGNSGKFVTTDGTTASWGEVGITNVTASATSITLTSTSTLAVITPTSYGVTVKLQDATSDTPKDAYHAIDNQGAFPIRVLDSTGALKGFVYAKSKTIVGLVTASAAGTWSFSDVLPVGASAHLATSTLTGIAAVIDLGSSREMIIGSNTALSAMYAVVYDAASNLFGSITLVRSAANLSPSAPARIAAVLSGADQVLVASCTSTTAFEAVVLSVSGTTITVNTAATATLSANFGGFADGSGLIAVGSSFVTSYLVSTPACQIRAISISGTTVTIGAATVLTGTAGGGSYGSQIVASGSVVIAFSTLTTSLYTQPFTVSGSTLSAGTGTTSTASTTTINKVTALGTRWAVLYNNGNLAGAIVSLSGTTTTISIVTVMTSGGFNITDAIAIGSNKVLVLSNNSTGNANILTDTAGTASAGTAIDVGSGTATRTCIYSDGTNAAITQSTTAFYIDCSAASPVISNSAAFSGVGNGSNAMLAKTAGTVYGAGAGYSSSGSYLIGNLGAIAGRDTVAGVSGASRGKSDRENWCTAGINSLTKVECIA